MRSQQVFVERVALHQLHHQRQHAVLLLEAEERGDVGMVERGEDARLALEPRHALRVGDERLGQRLQSDVAAQVRIMRPVDLTHAAGAQRAADLVGTDAAAGLQGHRER